MQLSRPAPRQREITRPAVIDREQPGIAEQGGDLRVIAAAQPVAARHRTRESPARKREGGEPDAIEPLGWRAPM